MADVDLRALAEAATPGPWWLSGGEPWSGDEAWTRRLDSEGGTDAEWDDWAHSETGSLFHGDVVRAEDARFIAAANPAAVLALLDRLDHARSRLAAVKEALLQGGQTAAIRNRDAIRVLLADHQGEAGPDSWQWLGSDR